MKITLLNSFISRIVLFLKNQDSVIILYLKVIDYNMQLKKFRRITLYNILKQLLNFIRIRNIFLLKVYE